MIKKKTALALLVCLIILYSVTFSLLSLRRHQTLYSNAFDLGNMDQTLWNTLRGRLLRFTNWPGGTTRLAAHMEPILIPLSLLYLLPGNPQTLLVFQTLALALGALPTYLLARRKMGELPALLFPLAYLLAPSLEGANLSDFHAVSLTLPLFLFAFYFLEKRNYRLFALFSLLAMACKEEIALLVAMLGLYLWVLHRKRRLGSALVVVGVLWFLLSLFIIIPHFSLAGRYPYLSRYAHLGTSPKEVIANLLLTPSSLLTLLLAPEKISYLGGLFLSLGLLPLLAPELCFLSLPSLAINLLSASPWMASGGAHYSAPILPFFMVAAIYGMARLMAWLRKGRSALPLIPLAIISLYHYQYGFSPLAKGVEIPPLTPHHQLLETVKEKIPPTASVSAQTALNPHISQREDLYLFPEGQGADYILLDATTSTYPLSIPEYKERVEEVLESGRYRLLFAQDGYLLLEKGETAQSPLPESFSTFVKASPEGIIHPLSVTFGGKLELLGYDVERVDWLVGRKGSYEFTLYWRALGPLDAYRIALLFARDDGALVYSLADHAATAWWPTPLWREGEVIAVRSPPVFLGERRTVHLNLAVVKGGGSEWRTEDRLRPITSRGRIETYEEGTILYLTTLHPR